MNEYNSISGLVPEGRLAAPTDISQETREILDKTYRPGGDWQNIFKVLARIPTLMRRYNALGGYILTRGNLEPKDREIAILRVAYRTRCRYEFAQHVPLGEGSGLSEDDISRLADGDTTRWDDRARTLLQLVDELMDTDDLTDDTWSSSSENWHEDQMLELIVLVGFYRMTALFLKAAAVPLDPHLERYKPLFAKW